MIKIKILLAVMLFISLSCSNVLAEPSVGTVTIDPNEPILKSDVTLTAEITDTDEISSVTLWVKECDENTGLCNDPFSVDMSNTGNDNEYTAEFTLKFNTATFFDYWFDIDSNGNTTTVKDDSYTVNYKTGSSDNGSDNDGDSNGSPGFELIALFIALFAAIVLYKKKR